MITIVFLLGIILEWWHPSLWWMLLTLFIDLTAGQGE